MKMDEPKVEEPKVKEPKTTDEHMVNATIVLTQLAGFEYLCRDLDNVKPAVAKAAAAKAVELLDECYEHLVKANLPKELVNFELATMVVLGKLVLAFPRKAKTVSGWWS